MKKLLLLALIALANVGIFAQDAFDKGDKKIDLTVGVGMVDYSDKSRATFDQHLGMEWGIGKMFDKVTIGLGFAVNNIYGATFESRVAGEYDYSYNYSYYGKSYDFSENKWVKKSDSKKMQREGVGTADADVSREDVNAVITVSFHYTPIPKLDTFLKIGAGVGIENYLFANYRNETGFYSADVNECKETKYTEFTTVYKYNDLDHVKWNGYDVKVAPSVVAYIGATYYFTSNFGATAQFGLISSNIKPNDEGYPSSYSLFAIGATYKF